MFRCWRRNKDYLLTYLLTNSWIMREAEFLDVIGKKFSRFFPLLTDFTPPLPEQSSLKLVCNVNIVYGNLKSENSQDFHQKTQRNWIWLLVPIRSSPLKRTCYSRGWRGAEACLESAHLTSSRMKALRAPPRSRRWNMWLRSERQRARGVTDKVPEVWQTTWQRWDRPRGRGGTDHVAQVIWT